MRIACTNDFLGSFSPMRTSYGSLPGGEGLKNTVERLRDEGPTVWADAGDFAQGGPLAPMTGGAAGFEAAAGLGIDVAAVGNHELDWGVEHLQEHAPKLGFPLLCANAELGFPATAVVPTEAGDVGFVGLTNPNLLAYAPGAPEPEPDLGALVGELAVGLRGEGADWVVALLHDGADWKAPPAGGDPVAGTARLEALAGPWLPAVDAIVAGHTLGRFFGGIGAAPVAQPWAFGAEVGVIELRRGKPGRVRAVRPEPAGRWTGPGAALIDEAEDRVLGELRRPLRARPGADPSLMDFLARALRRAAGAHAAVVPTAGMHQPAIGGVLHEWPAGPVTEADLLRVLWWTDDSVVVGEVSRKELEALSAYRAKRPYPQWGLDAAPPGGTSQALLAAPKDFVAATVECILGRRVDWRDAPARVREAARAALRRGTA